MLEEILGEILTKVSQYILHPRYIFSEVPQKEYPRRIPEGTSSEIPGGITAKIVGEIPARILKGFPIGILVKSQEQFMSEFLKKKSQ